MPMREMTVGKLKTFCFVERGGNYIQYIEMCTLCIYFCMYVYVSIHNICM
jgi:hypothetical protein